ncbi:glycoside hydrolase family 3 protein [Butyrivibrio sp. YAB3001]|uniref:glycoside hydrolase family 3 protein n=1 Tax=Butyrivibrio sp. YAB3001 TaxID=1520812 RepID=UPI0008F64BEE|nr:glycoside hydrolase family 3 protein [Butyrivibrio sp. YAB3001]SFB68192.1 beta-glucosidase [Butyrivibrio sp. YAB3001]
MQKRIFGIITIVFITISITACGKLATNSNGALGADNNTSKLSDTESLISDNFQGKTKYAGKTVDEILSALTLDQKAAQMVQPACYNIDTNSMGLYDYGSILSKEEALDYRDWQTYVENFQNAAVESDAGIPYLYGQDDVHGVNYALNSVIFPHNIGLGAANDEELMYLVGQITADEAKLCHMLWNFSPCVAQSVDPRWGRTYESYGSDLDIIKRLSAAYTKGQQDAGLIACAKHFLADGNVKYGTGEEGIDSLIDRGDAQLSDDEIKELLSVYQAQIDAGVKTIMISHSSLNGLKMHENKKYIDILKNDMGFNGFIVSDWDSVKNTSPNTYKEQVITSVNAGIDMLMEVETYEEARQIIVQAVKDGEISEDRINDAVRRILQVKKDAGLFEDPFLQNMETVKSETGSDEYREVAEKLVEESQVLIKNDNNTLPFKDGFTVFLMGPAMDNDVAQCGGWTIDWNESPMKDIPGVTSIKEGLELIASEHNITITTKTNEASNADVVLLVIGEEAYAEWYGDAVNMDICGEHGLTDNKSAIKKAKELGKPIVCLIIAGRHVFIKDYIDQWDSVVMSYLPGSEGQGIAKVLCGDAKFTGKLPSSWYADNTGIDTQTPWLEQGYGLTY